MANCGYENKCSMVSAAEVSGAQSAAATKAYDHSLVVKRGMDFQGAEKISKAFEKMYEDSDCGDGFVTKFRQSVEITRKPLAKNVASCKAFGHIDSSRSSDHENLEEERSKQQHVMEKQMRNEASATHVFNYHNDEECLHRVDVNDDQHSKQQLIGAAKSSSETRRREEYGNGVQVVQQKTDDAVKNSSETSRHEECENRVQVVQKKIDGAGKNSSQTCHRKERENVIQVVQNKIDGAVNNPSQNCRPKECESGRQLLKKKVEGAIQMMNDSSQDCRHEEYEYETSKLNVNEQNFIKKMMRCDEVRSQKWLRERADLEDFMIKVLNEMKMQGMKIRDEKSFLQKIVSLSREKSKMQGDRIAESDSYQHQAHGQRMKGYDGDFYVHGEVTIEDMEPCNMGMQRRMFQHRESIVTASTDAYNNGGAYNAGGGGCYTTPGKRWY